MGRKREGEGRQEHRCKKMFKNISKTVKNVKNVTKILKYVKKRFYIHGEGRGAEREEEVESYPLS